jgi:hypothetical protein
LTATSCANKASLQIVRVRDGLAEMGTGAEIVVGQPSLGPGPAWARVGRRRG